MKIATSYWIFSVVWTKLFECHFEIKVSTSPKNIATFSNIIQNS